MEDPIAISRLKQGDLNGLESLVNRYQAQAVHAAYLIVYDRALAEDIAQTAFLKLVEKVHQFDEKRAFMPWFLRIVVNDALKIAKKQKLQVSLDEESDEGPHSWPSGWRIRIQDPKNCWRKSNGTETF